MRDYAKAEPKMWHGGTFKALRRDPEGLIVALYLMTSPSSNMLGLFSQPVLYMAHETGLGLEGAWKGLNACIKAGFCSFDEASEMVWVHEMARYQIAPALKGADLRVKGIQKDYDALPDNPFLGPFFDRYAEAFKLTGRRGGNEAPSQAPSKPLRSQEQEQEQEQEEISDVLRTSSSSQETTKPGRPSIPCPYGEIVDAYHQALPMLPAIRLRDGKTWLKRQKAMRDLWGWVLSSRKSDGTRRAETGDEAMDWFRGYFARAAENDFITGRTAPGAGHEGWRADFDYLLTDRGMRQVIERTRDAA